MSNSFASVHPELVCEWSEKNLPLTPDKITFGSNKIMWWKGSCGHEWQASVKSRSIGEKCPICSGARVVEGINDLQTLKPEIAAEWSVKNGDLKPTMVSVGSHKKVIWKGKCGHEWTASVKSRTINGTGCPYCSHNTILEGFNDLATVCPDVAAEWSEKNLPLLPTQVTAFANRKAWWKCSKGHEWNTLISTRSGGSKCPYCSGIILLKGFNDFATTHPQLAEEWSERNLPLTPDMVNEKSRRNVWWKCKKCGYEWKSVIYSRVQGTVSGDEIRLFIGRILQYGYRGGISTQWKSQNENDANCIAHAYATQILIWETIVGERDSNFFHKSASGCSKDFEKEYLDNIRCYCLVMSGHYIKNHFCDIQKYANIIEHRLYDENYTMKCALEDNDRFLKLAEQQKTNILLIDDKYEINIDLY